MAGLSNSIFDIPHSLEQVRRPEDAIKISTRKIIPKSASKLENFPSSTISYDFTLAANQHWIPSRSFIVIRDNVYRRKTVNPNINTAVQPIYAGDVAPAYNCQDNLFDGAEVTIGGFSMGNKTKLCPQISACEKRLLKSASWTEGVGASVETCKPEFLERKADVSADGVFPGQSQDSAEFINITGTGTYTTATGLVVGVGTDFLNELQVGDLVRVGDGVAPANAHVGQVTFITDATNMNLSGGSNANIGAGAALAVAHFGRPTARAFHNERLYQPPLGIWKSGKALPGARYELHLRPKPDLVYKQSALQSEVAALGLTTGAINEGGAITAPVDAEYNVNDIYLILAVVDNFERPPDKMKYTLDLEETDVLPRQIAGGAGIQENFTVSKSSFALSVALQNSDAGRNTLFPPSRFTAANDEQQTLTSLRIDYAGQSRPQPQTDTSFAVGSGTDTSSWYSYGQKTIGDLSYYDTGGANSIDVWRQNGPLYHYQWRKTGDDISTNVDVAVDYGAFGANRNLLLFYHFRRVLEFTIENGQVTNFLAQDA